MMPSCLSKVGYIWLNTLHDKCRLLNRILQSRIAYSYVISFVQAAEWIKRMCARILICRILLKICRSARFLSKI